MLELTEQLLKRLRINICTCVVHFSFERLEHKVYRIVIQITIRTFAY